VGRCLGCQPRNRLFAFRHVNAERVSRYPHATLLYCFLPSLPANVSVKLSKHIAEWLFADIEGAEPEIIVWRHTVMPLPQARCANGMAARGVAYVFWCSVSFM
jgi:hypothetical protein